MALNPDAERSYISELERLGETQVRSDYDHGRIPPGFMYLAANWLGERKRASERRREASNSEQIELMRRAASAAEVQATEARRANTKATIALIIAIASPIVSTIIAAIGIWMTHLDTHK